jgi:hypothetical protein
MKKTVINIATIPSRVKIFQQVLDTLYGQADEYNVYLNGHSEIPLFLNRPNINIFWSKHTGDIGALGKFFRMKHYKDSYYFTVDDDILYPKDYVKKMIECLNSYNNKVCVGVHGTIFKYPLQHYHHDTIKYLFGEKSLELPVDMLGTGTMLFDTSLITFDYTTLSVPVDPVIAIICKTLNIPLICISRGHRWLTPIFTDGIYQKTLKDKDLIWRVTQKLKKVFP